jgi:hypothetical protein
MVSIEVQSSYATEFLPISMPIVQLRAASMIWDNRYLFNVLHTDIRDCKDCVDRCLSFWPLCRLFFFDLRILITTLISSKSSYREIGMNAWFVILLRCLGINIIDKYFSKIKFVSVHTDKILIIFPERTYHSLHKVSITFLRKGID